MTSPVATWANEQPFLPSYEILDRIDEGTIANVFKVRAVGDGSIHALKALKPEHFASETAVTRFEDEYRILSSLHFPCLPEVSDYGVASDGTRYMVMEVVDGEALDHYLASHPDDLWILIFELVETLAFIHEHKLLHLDLKPGNILVKRGRFGDDEAPVVVLIDFGLSYRRDVGGEAKLIGTADYMAPEIIRGDESPTRAADYYSLGCVLFELIEGRPPFSGTAYEKFQAHLKEPIRFKQKKVEYSELHPWVEKLTAKDPNDRLDAFQTFRETIAVRLAEKVEPFNRAFALGYIDSLGVIGKTDLRRQVLEWVRSVEKAIQTGRSGGDEKDRDVAKPSSLDVDPGEDIGERIARELLSEAVEKEEPDSVPVNRTMILSGPPGSGTPHLIRSIGDELRLAGINVATLGAGGDWAELASSGTTRTPRAREVAVDPGSVMVDRFVRAWDRLRERSSNGALALLIEDFRRLSREEQEFMGYAIRRTALALSEGEEPGIFVVMGADASELQNVRDGAFEESTVLPVPPPGEEEVESIVRSFRGHLAGVDAVRMLTATLEKNLHGVGAMVMTLRRAVADRDLTLEHGTWSLRAQPATPATPDEAGASYYRHVLEDLSESGQRLVEWLCSHPASLTVNELTGISELKSDIIMEGLEATLPFRIISVNTGGETETLQITNNDIRKHFYELVDPSKRRRIHERFIAELSRRPLESWESLRTLAFHYERIGSVRDALTMRMRAVAAAREATDIFAVRELCETSIEYLDTVADPEWKTRRAHLARHFIKSWINTEWSVGNYGGLAKLVRRYFPAHEDVPLGFVYKYATSLERAGDVDDAIAVIEDGKRRSGGGRSETYNNILVHHASLLHGTGAHQDAIDLLETVDVDRVERSVRPRYYISYAVSNRALGNIQISKRYMDLTRKASRDVDDTDTLLRAQHYELSSLLSEAAYSKMKRQLRASIRYAAKRKAYRSLHALYFLASGAYYEEGEFRKAISYLRKSVRAAADIGFTELHSITNRF
ncbi:MAG: serine/threonine-protein kinase [bacterium]|nr:serine/threonine-protein kinase [bacterium]